MMRRPIFHVIPLRVIIVRWISFLLVVIFDSEFWVEKKEKRKKKKRRKKKNRKERERKKKKKGRVEPLSRPSVRPHEFLLKAAISLSLDKSWWVIRRHQSACQRRLWRGPHRFPTPHCFHGRARWTKIGDTKGFLRSRRVAQRNTGEIEKGRWLVVMLKPGEKRGNAPLEFLIRPFNGCRFEMPAIIIDDGWLKNRGCRGNNEADPFIISLGKNWRKRLLWRREGNINWNWICRYIFMQLVVVEKMDLLCSFPKNLNLEFKIWNWSKNVKNGKNLLSKVKR